VKSATVHNCKNGCSILNNFTLKKIKKAPNQGPDKDFTSLHYFWYASTKFKPMESRGTTTVILVLLIVFTFPIWVGLAGGLFGLIIGLIGGVVGIIGGVIGAIGAAIGGLIGGLFHWGFNGHWPFGFFHAHTFTIVLIAIVIVLISRSRKI
jgi:hypothetical protein